MAPRTKDTAAKAETGTDKPVSGGDGAAGGEWAALLKPSAGLKKVTVTRDGKPNPLAGFATKAVGNPLALPVKSGAQAKDVTNWLRQDHLNTPELEDAKLSIQYQDANGNVVRLKKEKVNGKTVTTYPEEIRQVHFVTKPGERVKRRYGKNEIVAWLTAQGETVTGGITRDQRERFKKANGYAEDAKETAQADV